MQMPDSYQIPDDPDAGRMDGAYLRTCLQIPTPMSGPMPEFPLAVRQAHFYMARYLNLQGCRGPTGMDATQLAFICTVAQMCGGLDLPEAEPPARTFHDDIEDGLAEYGCKVVVRYRNKERAGHFFSVADDKIVVLLDGEERKFRPDNVRLPEPGEFPEVAESISETVTA